MPHQVRNFAESHYYHIMSRGVNKQDIFHEDKDYQNFVNLMKIYSKKYNVDILCYCLMKNHFHILVYDGNSDLPNFMRCLKHVYSVYYNKKNNRIGPLFNDRYKAKTITNEKYLYVVFKYIIINPQKAGYCKFQNYKWNSFSEMQKKNSCLSIERINELFGSVKHISNFIEFEAEDYLSYFDDPIYDYEIKEKLKAKFGLFDVSNVRQYDISIMKKIVDYLHRQGLSFCKIANITQLSLYTVKSLVKN